MRREVPFTIDPDDLWPRDMRHRYRIYAVRGTGTHQEREVIAAAADAGGIGQALVTLNEEQKALGRGRRLYDLGRIGVLDVMPDGLPSPAGEWIVLPWDRGGAR